VSGARSLHGVGRAEASAGAHAAWPAVERQTSLDSEQSTAFAAPS
jgi:hypothetical protein